MRIPSTAWGHGETASGTQEAGAHEAATPRPPGSRLVFVSRPVAGIPVRAAGAVCSGDRAERAGIPEGTRTRGPPSRGRDRAAPFRIEPLSLGKNGRRHSAFSTVNDVDLSHGRQRLVADNKSKL